MWIYFYAAHLLGDFIFQSDSFIEQRKSKPIITLAKHVAIHVILMAMASLVIAFVNPSITSATLWSFGQAILIISIFHFVIDYGKIKLSKKMNRVSSHSLLFLIDQVLHFLTIIFVLHYFTATTSEWSFMDNIQAFYAVFTGNASIYEKIAAVICIFILATYGAGYFLGILLQNIAPNSELQEGIYRLSDEKTEVKTKYESDGRTETEITTIKTEQYFHDSPAKIGQIIGMLERALIVILMMIDLPQGLAFLAALKTLTRFKQFEHKQFAEYYLIGTLSSAMIGILLGIVASKIW
ncbi:DUF3307 domain-containing protein [Anoxybacillus flavithermus]|uniref:DUF3307 domain-containing protein n=1 Tax=Anoxybacillus flavithermus AK1 TaxID=1297581 RepID=M8DVR1_9BACL|nr:DUF3307 domain-containing protein [Anoxybacillus flavithermus]EMT44869.1 hypothetical protein H919_13160 [Anoxybacillus flavithermus AK1]